MTGRRILSVETARSRADALAEDCRRNGERARVCTRQVSAMGVQQTIYVVVIWNPGPNVCASCGRTRDDHRVRHAFVAGGAA